MLQPDTYRQLGDRLVFAFDNRNPHHSGVLKSIHEASGIAMGSFFLGFLLWLVLICLMPTTEYIRPMMPLVVIIILTFCAFLIFIYLISTAIMFTMLIVLFFMVPYHLWYAFPSDADVIASRVY